jgi:hypothetical protein
MVAVNLMFRPLCPRGESSISKALGDEWVPQHLVVMVKRKQFVPTRIDRPTSNPQSWSFVEGGRNWKNCINFNLSWQSVRRENKLTSEGGSKTGKLTLQSCARPCTNILNSNKINSSLLRIYVGYIKILIILI